MNVSIITVFKELYEPFLTTSLIHRAQEKQLVSFDVVSLFDFVKPKERIDSPSYGPGAGMLLKPLVVEQAITDVERRHGPAFKIFFSPQGQTLDQTVLAQVAARAREAGHVALISARYEGMDARVEERYADMQISVGNFVIMGGDIPAMMLLEGMLRLVPGVVGKEESIEHESFIGPFLDYPEYTEPVEWQGMKVPEIIRSGHHAAIAQWRTDQAVRKTVFSKFEWLRSHMRTDQERTRVLPHIPPHYVVLMHDQVLVGSQYEEGSTSVMSIDIHDIARSSCTYGIKNFFIVTPFSDQQKIVEKFLSFWRSDEGIAYNEHRHHALNLVHVVPSLDGALDVIEKSESKKALLIATSARKQEKNVISFYDQSVVWKQERPVVFVLGTGQGLSQQLMDRCDYTLMALKGFTDFNHLSVRSAAAIIMDRWIGVNEHRDKTLPE